MGMKHLKGALVPSNPDAVTEQTAQHIHKAVRQTSWDRIAGGGRRSKGIIDFDTHTPLIGNVDNVFGVVGGLTALLNQPGVAELGLQGTLMMTVETDSFEPFLFRINVRNGKVSHQQADLLWKEDVPFTH